MSCLMTKMCPRHLAATGSLVSLARVAEWAQWLRESRFALREGVGGGEDCLWLFIEKFSCEEMSR